MLTRHQSNSSLLDILSCNYTKCDYAFSKTVIDLPKVCMGEGAEILEIILVPKKKEYSHCPNTFFKKYSENNMLIHSYILEVVLHQHFK